jgi:hypothetical protein
MSGINNDIRFNTVCMLEVEEEREDKEKNLATPCIPL